MERMDATRFPRRALDYRPRGKKSAGNPVNDGRINSIETETG